MCTVVGVGVVLYCTVYIICLIMYCPVLSRVCTFHIVFNIGGMYFSVPFNVNNNNLITLLVLWAAHIVFKRHIWRMTFCTVCNMFNSVLFCTVYCVLLCTVLLYIVCYFVMFYWYIVCFCVCFIRNTMC